MGEVLKVWSQLPSELFAVLPYTKLRKVTALVPKARQFTSVFIFLRLTV